MDPATVSVLVDAMAVRRTADAIIFAVAVFARKDVLHLVKDIRVQRTVAEDIDAVGKRGVIHTIPSSADEGQSTL